jgi:PAS domain S-box-containing protein
VISPSPELFRLMADRVQDYAIFLLDPEGRIISWNPGAQRIKGYAADEVIGRHFSVFYNEGDRARRWPESELRHAATQGRFEDNGWRVRKDGSQFWANVVITALRDGEGRLLGFSKITRDLTQRREEEERLRQSEERFRLLVDAVQDYAIFMLDAEGIVTSWNSGARRIKGYEASEILGQHFSICFTPDEVNAGRPWNLLAIARDSGRAEDEGWRQRKDGSRFWAKAVITAMYDGAGRVRGFAKVTQDLTQQRQAEVLEANAQRLQDFIAVLAHELRNPLAPIRNAATLLKMFRPGQPGYDDLCEAIERQSAQLAHIVDDLLDVSRITRGTLAIKRRPINLADVIARAVETAQPAIDAGAHQLELRVPPEPVRVMGDSLRLAQALTNLLNNAARYTAPGGRIEVALEIESGTPGSARLAVRDNGRGIEPQMLSAIFGMFVQAREATGRSGEPGLGVGLALARNIVELHHGTIEARSGGLGKGSEFVIQLPLAQAAEVAQTAPAAAQEKAGAAKRVLIVDDNVDAATMLCAALEILGHKVKVAHSGAEALRIAAKFHADVVLLDIGMPGMNGFEVARRLRERPDGSRALIVAVTGWGKDEDLIRSRDVGIDLHFVKPLEREQLEAILSSRPSVH